MDVVIGAIIGVIIGALISGAIIWVVSKLNLGLEVDNFGWAMLAGLLVGFLTHLVMSFMSQFGGFGGFLINLVVAAGVIFGLGKVLKGLTVNGFPGALLAALAIAGINLLIGLIALQSVTA